MDRNLGQVDKLAVKIQNLHQTVKEMFPNAFGATRNIDDFTLAFIKQQHSKIGLGIIANTWREKMACPAQENWIYLVPSKIPTALAALCTWVRNEMKKTSDLKEMVKICATFLTNFLHIHPFSNGNGRVARLLVSWLLCPVTIVPIALYVNVGSRETYLQCLRNSRSVDNPRFEPVDLSRFILDSILAIYHNVIFSLELH
jgi:Fic family protein